MKKKRILQAFLVLAAYLLLLLLLTYIESSDGMNLKSAAWFSILAMIDVEYSDFIPMTIGGKLIGCVFALLGTFIFAFFIGIVITLLRGRLLPALVLAFSGGKDLYIFEDDSPAAHTLANRLHAESSRNIIIFSNHSKASPEGFKRTELYTDLDTESIIRKSGKSAAGSKCSVLCLGDDGFTNYLRASALLKTGVSVICMTEYQPDQYPTSLVLFNPYISVARAYWNQNPAGFSEKNIVLIGTGKYAEALLEQALIINVFSPDQQINYLIYGDFLEFRRNHRYLSQICRVVNEEQETPEKQENNSARCGDVLFFKDIPWNEDSEALTTADRIILCFDQEDRTLSVFNTLHKYFPISAEIHAKLSYEFENVTAFGLPDTLFTSENVLEKQLDQQARTIHNIYLENTGSTSPRWEDLNDFMRRSNIASADHIPVKMRLLLGETSAITKENFTAAFHKWQEEWSDKKDLFRCIEHERWVRFHLMNNWQFSEERDNFRRLHPLIKPFESISDKDRTKDDGAWEILKELGDK